MYVDVVDQNRTERAHYIAIATLNVTLFMYIDNYI